MIEVIVRSAAERDLPEVSSDRFETGDDAALLWEGGLSSWRQDVFRSAPSL